MNKNKTISQLFSLYLKIEERIKEMRKESFDGYGSVLCKYYDNQRLLIEAICEIAKGGENEA